VLLLFLNIYKYIYKCNSNDKRIKHDRCQKKKKFKLNTMPLDRSVVIWNQTLEYIIYFWFFYFYLVNEDIPHFFVGVLIMVCNNIVTFCDYLAAFCILYIISIQYAMKLFSFASDRKLCYSYILHYTYILQNSYWTDAPKYNLIFDQTVL